jgi:hypothetical protein
MSSEEDRVIALATSGLNLSSMFVTVGPSCLSTDSIFKAIEYKRQLEAWNQKKKERKAPVDEMMPRLSVEVCSSEHKIYQGRL